MGFSARGQDQETFGILDAMFLRRFIAALTFSLLFLTGNADTIGHNHVYLRDSMIADFTEGEIIRVKIQAANSDATDFLLIHRYFGCGGSPESDHSIMIIRDSATREIIYRDTVHSISRFNIPLGVLLTYQNQHPGAVFTGSCVAAGIGEAKMRYWNGVRFEITLE